ncbi:retinal homeobox protein Rx isoform X2 [Drosophila gunungcola]|uniref:retinal homeobox protein Rx isoform X2 n=1 Tax=Drosophila gunungcola TaxID=103775 RepID=UPI0022E2AD91|nr:retinal homeobox protein Rx isoform X2 [Drosophila gunungcola]
MDIKASTPPALEVASGQPGSPPATKPGAISAGSSGPGGPGGVANNSSAASNNPAATFQHIFEQLVQQGGGNQKLPPKQLEHLRHLLGNVRDAKNLQMIVEKFKNLEQFHEHYAAHLANNNTVISTEDSNDLLKDNARKFGSGGQTLTPRHTIDAILGLKNRNGTGNGNGRNAESVSDGAIDPSLGDEDATDLRCGMTLTQLRSMDSHMASMLQQHAKNGGGLPYGPPTPPGGQQAQVANSASLHHGQQMGPGQPGHPTHSSHPPHPGHAPFGYHNAFGFGQGHGHGHGYGHQEEAAGNYLNSMHQMVEANQLQPGASGSAPPNPLPPSSFGSHQQHLAALAAQAQEQQQQQQNQQNPSPNGKYAKSSPTGAGPPPPPPGAYFLDSQTASLAPSQIGYDERSMSSASDMEEDDDDAAKLQLDVTSPPTPAPRGPLAAKRKSAGAFCDDNEPKLANGQLGGNYGIRARSLEEVHHQQQQQQQQHQSHHHQQLQQQQQGFQHDFRNSNNGNGNPSGSSNNSGDHGERLNADSDSLVNGSCASSEDLNQTNSSEQGEKITSGSDDEGGR